MITMMLWFKRKASTGETKTPQAVSIIKPEGLMFFQVFAATFIACALLQDFTTVFFPSFYIPLSAKYVMAICASLPGYVLKRRG
jgi:hypothetical protein